MARLKPSCLCIRPVIFALLLGMFGLAFTAQPVMAEAAPLNNICPNNTVAGDDTPWGEFSDLPATEAGVGPQYMIVQVACWLVDAGLIESGGDSQPQSMGSGNREINTADELSQY